MFIEKAFHNGASGPLTDRELQELLCVFDYPVAIDGSRGPATDFALTTLKADLVPGASPDAAVDEPTRVFLMKPFAVAEAFVEGASDAQSFSDLVRDTGVRYWREIKPKEIGGNNRGPWVRFFSDGAEGDGTSWCANFSARTVVTQAEVIWADRMMRPLAYPRGAFRAGWCPAIEQAARANHRLVTSEDVVAGGATIHAGMLFLVRGPDRVNHVGIVAEVGPDLKSFLSVEGNAPDLLMGQGVDYVTRRFRNCRSSAYYFVDLG